VAKGLVFLEKEREARRRRLQPGGSKPTPRRWPSFAFKEANAPAAKYDKVLDAATKFVKGLQYGDGLDPKDAKFRRSGLRAKPGGQDRPDLSRTRSSWWKRCSPPA